MGVSTLEVPVEARPSTLEVFSSISSEGQSLIIGIAGRMNRREYGSTQNRMSVLTGTLIEFTSKRMISLYNLSPAMVWEALREHVNTGPHNEFDSYECGNPREHKYPPVGACSCGRVEVSMVRVNKLGKRHGQWRPELSAGCKYKPRFTCSVCIKKEFARTRANHERPRAYYSYARALQDSNRQNSPKTKKHLSRMKRKGKVVIKKTARMIFGRK